MLISFEEYVLLMCKYNINHFRRKNIYLKLSHFILWRNFQFMFLSRQSCDLHLHDVEGLKPTMY